MIPEDWPCGSCASGSRPISTAAATSRVLRSSSHRVELRSRPPRRHEKDRADECVAVEKRAIDSGQIEPRRAPMFVDQRAGDQRHRAEINRAQRAARPKASNARNIARCRRCARRRRARCRGARRANAVLRAIELKILRRVDQIEARDPADNTRPEKEGRQSEPAGCRNPGADWSDGQRERREKNGSRQ